MQPPIELLRHCPQPRKDRLECRGVGAVDRALDDHVVRIGEGLGAELLPRPEQHVPLAALDAGDALVTAKGGENTFLKAFDEADGIDKLENLQTHHNEEVYEKAVAILEKHFGEDDDDDENILPNTASEGMFTFGAQPLAATAGFAF